MFETVSQEYDRFTEEFFGSSYERQLSAISPDKILSKQEVEEYAQIIAKESYRPKNYKHWVEKYDEMAVHVNGELPEKLIKTRRPKEDDERYYYRLANYEPITKGIMREAVNSLFRIFNEQNYELRLSPDLEAYIQKNNFKNLNFINWVQSHVVLQMILDPNGLLVVLPDNIRDALEKIDVKVETVCSKDIVLLEEDIIAFLSDEQSIVYNYNRPEKTGKVYYILTRTHFYKLKQIDRKSDKEFELIEIYEHNLGFVPYVHLGGEWNSALGVYESYFNSFVPFGNEAIKQYSDWQGVMVTCAYPTRVIQHIECNYESVHGRCVDGYINGVHGDSCPKCHGTGNVPPSSPYGVYVRQQNDSGMPLNNSTDPNTPPLEYISPPTDILKFQSETLEQLLKKARESLHLDKVNEAQSGSAKVVDREREYSMILKISNNVFDNIIGKTLYMIELYREINTPKPPQIIKPREFNLKTETDLINDISILKAANAPTNVVREVTRELLKRRFMGDTITYYKELFLMEYLVMYNHILSEQLTLMQAGVLSLMDVARATYAPPILEGLMREGLIELAPENFKEIADRIDKEIVNILEALKTNSVPRYMTDSPKKQIDISTFQPMVVMDDETLEAENDFEFEEVEISGGINNDGVRGMVNKRQNK